jgi:hypothetical protein
MNARGVGTDVSESSKQQNVTRTSRSSNAFVSFTNLSQKIRSVHLTRRSTLAVVAQGLHFLRRKAPLHKLDRLARIGFPLLFILCNCIYWYFFVFYLSD